MRKSSKKILEKYRKVRDWRRRRGRKLMQEIERRRGKRGRGEPIRKPIEGGPTWSIQSERRGNRGRVMRRRRTNSRLPETNSRSIRGTTREYVSIAL